MNHKTAKKLRRIALGLAADVEAQGKKIEREAYVIKNPTTAKDAPHPGTIYVKSDTWKGAYKALKKGVRTGKINERTL